MSDVVTIAGLRRILRELPPELKVKLRDEAQAIANDVAPAARSRAGSTGRGWQNLGPTIAARRETVPVVKAGSRAEGAYLYGSEFGGRRRKTTQQFLPWLGKTGYVLWPTVRAMRPTIEERYSLALHDVLVQL
jgi:hypothetical protein